jgi:hypothetical protein
MKITPIQLISILLVILVTFACLFRYTIIPSNVGVEGNYAPVYKLDRWTGNVEVIQGKASVDVTHRSE